MPAGQSGSGAVLQRLYNQYIEHSGPFRWEGTHYQHRVVNPWAVPLQKPHPRVWIPGVLHLDSTLPTLPGGRHRGLGHPPVRILDADRRVGFERAQEAPLLAHLAHRGKHLLAGSPC